MKTSAFAACLGLAFCLHPLSQQAQWYGQRTYQHPTTLSSAKRTFNRVGYVMAGFRDTRPPGSALPDFVVDHVNAAAGFGLGDFSREYQVLTDCSGQPVAVNESMGVSVIETNNQGNGEAYAITGAYSGGVFFATLDINGSVINKNFWAFPGTTPNVKKPSIKESPTTPGNYYICGNYGFDAYVMMVKVTGAVGWSNWYYAPDTEPRDLMESPYNPTELIVVGRTDIVASTVCDAFFMSLDAGTGAVNYFINYTSSQYHSDDWFACIQPARGGECGPGYILGGRCVAQYAPPPIYNINYRYSQMMTRLDRHGNVCWSTLIKPDANAQVANLINGTEVMNVYERRNTNNGQYEYYGVAGSFYFPSSGTQLNNLVVFKLDEQGQNTLSPNEFHYINGSMAPPANPVFGFCDMTAIETGGGPDDGLQVFGTDPNTNEHYFIKTYFNGVAGCQDVRVDIDSIFPGVKQMKKHQISSATFPDCGPNSIVFNELGINPTITDYCYASSVPGGSNLRSTGLVKQKQNVAGVQLFPNPTSRFLSVSANSSAQVTIYNSLGQLVKVLTVEAGNSEIDFEALGVAQGYYTLEVKANGETSQHKIMYQH